MTTILFFHSVNVAILSLLMGMELGLGTDDLQNLGLAAILHDIGKMFVNSEILHKPTSLAPDEYKEVKQHVKLGYNFLKATFEIPAQVYVAVLQHHERYDGKGYPNELGGDNIHLFGRIIAVTDVYDALTANRPYRKPIPASKALDYIVSGNGTLFDRRLTNIFVRKVAHYPVGTYVRLNSGHSGIVFKNYCDASDRPVVKLIVDRLGNRIKPIYVDLKHGRRVNNLKIVAANEWNVVEMIQNCS